MVTNKTSSKTIFKDIRLLLLARLGWWLMGERMSGMMGVV